VVRDTSTLRDLVLLLVGHLIILLKSFLGFPGPDDFKKLLAPNRYWFDTHSERRTIQAKKPVQGPNAEHLSLCARNSYRVRTQELLLSNVIAIAFARKSIEWPRKSFRVRT
jgi:hypothetical protein